MPQSPEGEELSSTTTRIRVIPKVAFVGIVTIAEKLLAPIVATSAADFNPFAGKLTLAVEARLTSPARWYVFADPAVIDHLEYAYLAGEEGPQIETRAGFEVDGLEMKCRLDFGAAFIDWRGVHMNPGQ